MENLCASAPVDGGSEEPGTKRALSVNALVGDYESDEEEEEVAAGQEVAAGPLCGVCALLPRKYCCPRCGVLTCSLECCNEHKKANDCDGRRDVAKYVKLQDFSLKELRADVTFLEVNKCEISLLRKAAERSAGSAKRARFADEKWRGAPKLQQRRGKGGAQAGESAAALKLQRAAERRRVRLLLMPEGMARRTRNSSSLGKGDVLYWRVEWVFEIPGDEPLTLIDNRADERVGLSELLARRIKEQSLSTRARLAPYLATPANCALLLQRQPAPANQPRYDTLDKDVSLELA